jgi:ADP-ribose pyrophosphatase YjhB (NUDIX family)
LREDVPLLGRWIAWAFQQYWRVVRGLHLSVEACVIDDTGRVLMMRNESGSGWQLPAGPVRNNETAGDALRRILRTTAGIEVNIQPEMVFFYARGKTSQTGMFLVREWRQVSPRKAGLSSFPASALPNDAVPGVAERIRRCLEGRTSPQL